MINIIKVDPDCFEIEDNRVYNLLVQKIKDNQDDVFCYKIFKELNNKYNFYAISLSDDIDMWKIHKRKAAGIIQSGTYVYCYSIATIRKGEHKVKLDKILHITDIHSDIHDTLESAKSHVYNAINRRVKQATDNLVKLNRMTHKMFELKDGDIMEVK